MLQVVILQFILRKIVSSDFEVSRNLFSSL